MMATTDGKWSQQLSSSFWLRWAKKCTFIYSREWEKQEIRILYNSQLPYKMIHLIISLEAIFNY